MSFSQVNVREYQRVLGDNPSVRSGPPISIGWNYDPDEISVSLDDFEAGRGSPRASSEYIIPRATREQMLKDHAEVRRQDIAKAVRGVQKAKHNRMQTRNNLAMTGVFDKMEGAKRKAKKIIGLRSSYAVQEARLWDNAHSVAVEKAKRLEESIRNGESVGRREFYSVGSPYFTGTECDALPFAMENDQIDQRDVANPATADNSTPGELSPPPPVLPNLLPDTESDQNQSEHKATADEEDKTPQVNIPTMVNGHTDVQSSQDYPPSGSSPVEVSYSPKKEPSPLAKHHRSSSDISPEKENGYPAPSRCASVDSFRKSLIVAEEADLDDVIFQKLCLAERSES